MRKMNLKNKIVIITGAGRGIGQVVALEFARRGAKIFCVARSKDQLQATEKLIAAHGGTAAALVADVTDPKQVRKMVDFALRKFGRIDVLINNAGSFRAVGAVWEVDPALWAQDVQTNLFGAFYCSQAVLPAMMKQRKGMIINLAGGGIDRPFLGASGYGSSKTGLMRLTDTLALELQEAGYPGIQVCAIDPGFIRSAMTEYIPRTQGGARWIPYMKKWLRDGKDHPAEEAAVAIAKLIAIAKPALSLAGSSSGIRALRKSKDALTTSGPAILFNCATSLTFKF
jgi:NAD(P)-dependent dehydrogenase (short-subunit alcohol dehydrogenase family)